MRTPARDRNDIWSMDFVTDQLADGRRFLMLTVIDLFTRECLEIEVGRSLKSEDVVRVMERPKYERGVHTRIYCDNGPEFVSGLTDQWAYSNGVQLDFSRRGKPTDNAVIESFNGRFRDECLNAHWFETIEDAKVKINAWQWDYNEHRPHRSLEGLTPREFVRQTMLNRAADSQS